MAVENNVRAVERALAILDCFNSSKNSFTLTELARAIDLSPSTTLRLISTLESKNYIYRNPENMRYYLGYRLAQLSDIAFSKMCIRDRSYFLDMRDAEIAELLNVVRTTVFRHRKSAQMCIRDRDSPCSLHILSLVRRIK